MIVLCANDTSWDHETDAVIPGGQGDRYLSPVLQHLPAGMAEIRRQPVAGEVCALMNHWSAYEPRLRNAPRLSVQLSHGIADKGYRSFTAAAQYSFTVFPGPALAERSIRGGLPRERTRILGYPKLDPVHRGEVASPWPERDGRIRVLWAPTHGGGSERHKTGNRAAPGAGASTWWHRHELLSLLDPERHMVMEAPHPRHHPRRQATLAEYVGADVVVGDGGSTMYEAWACGLPVVLPDWLVAQRNLTRARGTLLEAEVYAAQIGWHAARPDEFAGLVDRAAAEGISHAEAAFAERVLPAELRGHGGKLHAEFLLELQTSPLTHRTVIRPRRRVR